MTAFLAHIFIFIAGGWKHGTVELLRKPRRGQVTSANTLRDQQTVNGDCLVLASNTHCFHSHFRSATDSGFFEVIETWPAFFWQPRYHDGRAVWRRRMLTLQIYLFTVHQSDQVCKTCNIPCRCDVEDDVMFARHLSPCSELGAEWRRPRRMIMCALC